jgi:hypothetical protein
VRRKECACGCGTSLANLRVDAKYASYACSQRAKRRRMARRPDKGQTRRLSRDGRGVRLYLTEHDLAHLELHLPHLSITVAEKVKAARVRLQGKATG